MHRTRNENRAGIQMSGSSVSAMLKSVKGCTSPRQYKALCHRVNNASGYAEKKRLILAVVQAKQQK